MTPPGRTQFRDEIMRLRRKTTEQVKKQLRPVDEIALRTASLYGIDEDQLGITGFEDDTTKRLRIADAFLRKSGMSSLKRVLPALLSIKGQPYTLNDYFPFEPFFRTHVPLSVLLKTARQVSKCVQFDSEIVRLANGQQAAVRDLCPGDMVLSLDDDYRFVRGRIKNIWQNGSKPVLRIRTRMVAEIEITAEHRLRTFDGYLPASELRIGDRLAGVRQAALFTNKSQDRDRIVLTAYMLGDGCCGRGQWALTHEVGPALDE